MIEIATGEIALFWDTEPAQTGRLARALRADLAQLEAAEFLAKWRRWQISLTASRCSRESVPAPPGNTTPPMT